MLHCNTEKKTHTSVFRCLSPFKIGTDISLEQSVRADLSWKFEKHMEPIFFFIKSLRNFFWNKNLDFYGSYFQFLPWILFFWTYLESNAAVTIHLEDLAVTIYLFLKDKCICWWKISKCVFKYFGSMWSFFLYIFWWLSVTVCEKRHFYLFLYTVTLSRQNNLKGTLHIDSK